MRLLRLYGILISLVLTQALQGQVLFSEGFESGIPATWTVIDNDGLTPDTITSYIDSAWVGYVDTLSPADSFAVSTSKYDPAGTADDWLISPAISIGGTSNLTWEGRALNALKADGYEVRISTTTPTIPAFLSNPSLASIAAEDGSFTQRSVDLVAEGYSNQTIYIAFRNNSTDKFLLGIDDINVFDCSGLNADAGTIDTDTLVACSGSPTLDLGLIPVYSDSTPGNVIMGSTTQNPNWSPLVGRPFEDGACCDLSSPPYEVIAFQVTVSGNYDIVQIQSGYDGVMLIYTDSFDLTQEPPITFVAGNDDGDSVGVSEIVAQPLNAFQTYYLVSTGFDDGESGNHSTSFTGPGDVILQTGTVDDLPYQYEFVVSNSSGTIVSFGDDLTDTTIFSGSAQGDTFVVCGLSYIDANLSLGSYLNGPLSSLQSAVNINSCADITIDCKQVIIKQGLTVNAGANDTICSGEMVILSATGGDSYVWSTGDSTSTTGVSPLSPTYYSVTASNSFGCEATDEVFVMTWVADGGIITPDTIISCAGDSSLNLNINPEFTKTFVVDPTNEINGNTASIFTWDPLPGRPFANGNCCSGFNTLYEIVPFQVDRDGIYSISQTQLGYDGYLLVYTDPLDLTVSPPTTFVAGNDDSAGVAGVSFIDTAILNAGQTYYLISTGFETLDYGDYSSSFTGPGNIMLLSEPDSSIFGYDYLTVDNSGNIIRIGSDLSDTSLYSGSVAGDTFSVYGVSYFKDSVDINLYLTTPFSNLSGTSCLSVSDSAKTAIIFNPPFANAGIDDTICFGDTLYVMGNLSGGNSGSWNLISGTGNINDNNAASTFILNLSPGLNQFSWTVDNGYCQRADTIDIVVSQPIADAGANDTICEGQCTNLTATGGVNYSWNTGEITSSILVCPVASSDFIVTVTNQDGCSAMDTVTVIVNDNPVVSLQDATICPGSSTILDAGNPGATYNWSTNEMTATISVNAADIYSVTVTDNNGCSDTASATISLSNSLTVNLNDYDICDGDSVQLNAGNTGASYDWSTMDTTQTIWVNSAGAYSVTVTDTSGCSGSDTNVVTILQTPIADAGQDQTICEGETTTLSASGGGEYEWSTTDTTASIDITPALSQTYTVTVTGANNCKASDAVTVFVNALPTAAVIPNSAVICEGDTMALRATGGSSYDWGAGSSSVDSILVSPTVNTTYTVTVTDANGCSDTASALVMVNSLPTANAGPNDTICSGETTTLSGSGGTTYEWSTGANTASIMASPVVTTTYCVTVTDANGCSADDCVMVVVNDAPAASAGPDVSICIGESTTLTASGGDSYLWSNADPTEMTTVSPSTDRTYTVTVTNGSGCSATDSVEVKVNDLPIADAGSNQEICLNDSTTLVVTGGNSYLWNTGETNDTIVVSPKNDSTYTVEVTNADGCTDIASVEVIVFENSPANILGLDSNSYCTTSPTVTLSGIPSGGTFSGSGISGNSFDPASADTGIVVITYSVPDSNGCESTASATVTVDICIGVEELTAINQLIVYPNPVQDKLNLEFQKPIELNDDFLQIINSIGQSVRVDGASKLSGSLYQLDVRSLPAGNYWVLLNGKNTRKAVSFIKTE